MKLNTSQVLFSAGSAAALLVFVSCASKPENERNTSSAYRQGVPGGTWVESCKIPVTVAALDPASRKVTLAAPDEPQTTFTAGPDFGSFDRLRVGEQLQAAVARERSVFVRRDGPPPQADLSVAKELIKDIKQPSILRSDTVEKTAKVTAIEPRQNEATLQFADGTIKNISVRSDVNLFSFEVGQEVVVRTRSVAVLIPGKP